MNKEWLVKTVALGVIFLFIGAGIVSAADDNFVYKTRFVNTGDILYVGGNGTGNYTKIQDAIDNASDGDTVFVYDDSSPYYEYICIDKEIKVLGEDKNTTIIDGGKLNEVIIQITANNSSIEQFNLQNAPIGYGKAILIDSSHNVIVRNNIIKDCETGIYSSGTFCEFCYNFIESLGVGIVSYYKSDLFIHHNILEGAIYGIRLQSSKNCVISNNIINDSYSGLYLESFLKNKIYENTFSNNFKGVYLQDSLFNSFYRNNFLDNNLSASFLNTIFFLPIYNWWLMNYWDDALYIKRIPGYTFIFLGNDSLMINRSNFDLHPARVPYDVLSGV